MQICTICKSGVVWDIYLCRKTAMENYFRKGTLYHMCKVSNDGSLIFYSTVQNLTGHLY